ncbi:molecular chaperone DnaJ [Aliikangiella sp. G2MR2-5]|uniref:molecular chaperone DnaJ n=1 Tax=Aliikangiella sp. G2MR2-5 TaxID=2788943 RepID=UPI001AED87C0|nr:molecular chaperone DnaJ [Aliikangiella sp. G2MR2-5]
MQDIKSNLYECKHCDGLGTCKNADDDKSCQVCIKSNEIKGTDLRGLTCGTCGGIGLAEPLTERINKRTAPLLALGMVVALIILIFISAIFRSEYFSEILAFSSAIIGTVCGYYFSGANKVAITK